MISASVRQVYVVCCHQCKTTRLIYEMRPLSNVPSNRGAPDLDPAGYPVFFQDPVGSGSKQSGSGQPDSLPCNVSMHCVLSPSVKQKTSDILH